MLEPTNTPNSRPNDPYTCSTSILAEFTDVPGGLPLDSPEVQKRLRLRNAAVSQEPQEPGTQTDTEES